MSHIALPPREPRRWMVEHTNMIDRTNVEQYHRCPRCLFTVATRVATVRALDLDPVPRQIERYVRITHWQCMYDQEHSGDFYDATDDPPAGEVL